MSSPPTHLTSAPAPGAHPEAFHRTWRNTALIAGVFSAVVAVGLLFQQLTQPTRDPWKSPQLLALKEQLVSAPKDEQLKQQIRDLDLLLRRRYAAHLDLARRGGWMLLGGLAVFLLAARQAAALRKKLPMPTANPNAPQQAARTAKWSRWAVATIGAAAALVLLSLAFSTGTLLSPRTARAAPSEFASLAEMQANWPSFRGSDGNGVTIHTNLLLTWGTNAGEGIAWKTPVPAPGFNSPIAWGDRVFLSGGDAKKREVFCFNAKTGAVLWQKAVENVPGSPAKPPEIQEATGFAAATMATDGRRVFAIFANGDLAAFTLEGAPAWSKNLGVPKNTYGYATSLAVWQGKLIVQFDQGEGEPAGSKLYAFDGATGRIVWQQARPVEASWASPIVVEVAGKPQIVTLAKPWVIAYAAGDGAELWRVEGLEGEVTPSPILAGGLVMAVIPSVKLNAIRPDGQGDVTKTHVAWAAEDNQPDVTSPVSNGELVFTVTTSGVLTCFDAKTGKKVWEKELEIDFHASPALVGDRLLLISSKEDGLVLVVAVAREFKELGRSKLGEEVHASPAFTAGGMFIRGVKHLFCIGAQRDKLAKP
jgi:outer membrane protein assembly factor BamB